MPRPTGPLLLLALAVACDHPTEPPDIPPSSVALAGAEAECQADGQWIICHTTLTIETLNQPLVDFPEVPCGTIYETSIDSRAGIRWYNADDSVIVKRHVTQSIRGTWSLAADGAGPTVTLKGSGNWYDGDYADPNDLDSGTGAAHGELDLSAPGFGTIAHIAGLDNQDGHHGVFRIPDDPAVAAELCAALTR